MAINRRITASRRLVCQFDEAFWLQFSPEVRAEYNRTLEIEKLGDFSKLSARPTVFICKPLQSKWEHLAYDGGHTDYWGVFSTHVTAVENLGFDVKFEHGAMTEEMREEFPPNVVQNVASMIIQIANQTGNEFFFMPSEGALHYGQRVLVRAAMMKKQTDASGAAAALKNSK